MEDLRKLERVQSMLSFMESRGLSTTHQDSDRFLAQFLLFLVQPCEVLNMRKRCDLISEYLQKISATILEEALFCITEDCQQSYAELPSEINLENKSNLHLPEANSENMAKIGLDAMQRANSTLEDFLDTMNEKDLQLSLKEKISPKDGANHLNSIYNRVANESVTEYVHETPGPDPFDPLVHLLQCQGLLTERIRTELKSGLEYWELERKLCHALTCKKKILIEDVMRAIHLKSFDYRILNLLVYQLRSQQVNDLHMEFLSISEFLVEVSDDLYDYEDDVIENSFNILRMFVGIYGALKAPSMLAKCITEAEEKYERLSKALDPELSLRYWRRCEEATKEGGTASGHAFGTWSIPPVIVDEESFRSQQTIDNKPVSHSC